MLPSLQNFSVWTSENERRSRYTCPQTTVYSLIGVAVCHLLHTEVSARTQITLRAAACFSSAEEAIRDGAAMGFGLSWPRFKG